MMGILSLLLGTFRVKNVVQIHANQALCANVAKGFTEFKGKKQILLLNVTVNNI